MASGTGDFSHQRGSQTRGVPCAHGRSFAFRTYLLTGAEASVWEASVFADLFDDGVYDSEQLCLRRLSDKRATLAWDAALEGALDRYPEALPALMRTRSCGRALLGRWELRGVEVTVVKDGWIAMDGGWPHGRRPAGARHPVATSAPTATIVPGDALWPSLGLGREITPERWDSHFTDHDGDVTVDPATLKENRDLRER